MKIMVIEDYEKLNHMLSTFCRQEGHDVTQAFSAEEALKILNHTTCDVILLDLMLPDMQGESLIKTLRQFTDVYIIVLSAKVDTKGKINVLSLGADDYMTKPYSIEEVVAKLKNIEKRLLVQQPNIQSFNHGYIEIHPLSKEVYVNKKLIRLTLHEYNVLYLLSSHPQNVYSRDMIMSLCFDQSDAYDRVIDAFIKNIRKKIDLPGNHHSLIKTHYGIGYQFVGILDE